MLVRLRVGCVGAETNDALLTLMDVAHRSIGAIDGPTRSPCRGSQRCWCATGVSFTMGTSGTRTRFGMKNCIRRARNSRGFRLSSKLSIKRFKMRLLQRDLELHAINRNVPKRMFCSQTLWNPLQNRKFFSNVPDFFQIDGGGCQC